MNTNQTTSLTTHAVLTAMVVPCLFASATVSAQTYPPTRNSLTTVDEVWMSRPDYKETKTEPTYQTQITRIADQAAFDDNSQILAHAYAKNQPWNSDGTRIWLNTFPGTIVDAQTYNKIKTLSIPHKEFYTWSNTDPDLVYTIQKPDKLVKVNVNTGDIITIKTFTQFERVSYGNWQGQMSNDDAYIALQSKKGDATTVFVYNLVGDSVESSYDGRGIFPKNCAMSQSGNYVIVMWAVDETMGERKGITVHRRSDMAYLRSIYHRQKHADFGCDSNGNDVIVFEKGGKLVMIRLSNGEETDLLPGITGISNYHISCRNIDWPGWAFFSYFIAANNVPTSHETYKEIFAVKLDGSGRVKRYSHSFNHETRISGERDPFACPNRDGTKVMFRSDWGDGAGDAPIYSYVAQAADNVTSANSRSLRSTRAVRYSVNPTNSFGIINLIAPATTRENASVTIVSSNGRIVRYPAAGRDGTRNISGLANGSYYLWLGVGP